MSQLFGDGSESDTDEHFKSENEYAKKYNLWRKKEEHNKLKTKYGEDMDFEDPSSSSDDDEDCVQLTNKTERNFFKTLACLKNKDPSIYDNNVQFFNDEEEIQKEKKKKYLPMYLKDYDRKIILEKGGVLSDEEENIERDKLRSPTYVEEQNQLKESFKDALNTVNDADDGEWGGIFKERQKTKVDKKNEEADYKKWIAGQNKTLPDKGVETELKPLKDYWNKPDLDEGEKFLRDYILNDKFLANDEEESIPTYEEIVHDSDQDLSNDEFNIEKQEEFEHKYNFRFEEPDQEFIKRYPRTMENSLRRKDDKRSIKRQEIKERKKKEKDEKMQDLKNLRELKRIEIEEKLEKLKEITGNSSVGFVDADFDGDFDPEEHDKRMQVLFNEEFYADEENEQKPEFADFDKELEIENWENYNDENTDHTHCEDGDFNMDCEYDPKTVGTGYELVEDTRAKKRRKRKSKFAQVLSKPKPKYDPSDKNYEKYYEEYYKLDCEDIIGDIQCRFKYRKVVPNDFGLSTEEILVAKERELNKWCSLKKAVQIRPDHVEKYEQIAYRKKSQNTDLKKKILPSLFSPDPEEVNKQNFSLESNNLENDNVTVERHNGLADGKEINLEKGIEEISQKRETEFGDTSSEKNLGSIEKTKSEKKTKKEIITKTLAKSQNCMKHKLKSNNSNVENASRNTKNIDVKNKSKRKIRKENIGTKSLVKSQDNIKQNTEMKTNVENTLTNIKIMNYKNKPKKKTKSKKINNLVLDQDNRKREKNSGDTSSLIDMPRKKQKQLIKNNLFPLMSDARLSAYGINPKKFKNKLKYKHK